MELAVLKKTDFLGKSLSVFGTPDEPLFLAKEVADMLGHTNISMMVKSVSEDERHKHSLGRQGNAWFLTEYGLYELLMQSRNPIAKQFKQGIKQILKDIRQKGFYAAPSATADTERIIDTLIDAYNTQKHRISTLERQLSEATSISYPSKMNALTLPTNKPTNQSTNQSTNKTTNRAVPQSHRLNILQEVRYDNQDFYIYATADGTPLIYAKDAVRYLGLSTDHVKRYVTQYVRPENRIHANHPCDYRFGHRTHFITQGGLSDLYHRYRTLSPSTSKPFYDYFFPLLTAPVNIIE